MTPEKFVIDGIRIEELKADDKSMYYYHLKRDNKHLTLWVNLEGRSAATHIENTSEGTREIGTTTLLYQKALTIIQSLAQEYRTGIYYRFSTSDEKMQAWLRDANKGMTVLNGAEIKNTATGIEAVLEINP